uniref:Uncharacterized protein n=1 Tax=Elaeophora elaphi TaxID=1147741 RepID=A0A0R3S294_9BILA
MEVDFEPIASSPIDTTATSAVVPITAKSVGGEETYDVITTSPSSSSDGSSSEFVKVEHSDVQQSVGLVCDTLSFKMLQMRDVGDDEKGRTGRRYPSVSC